MARFRLDIAPYETRLSITGVEAVQLAADFERVQSNALKQAIWDLLSRQGFPVERELGERPIP